MSFENIKYTALSEELQYWETKNECAQLELEILKIRKQMALELQNK